MSAYFSSQQLPLYLPPGYSITPQTAVTAEKWTVRAYRCLLLYDKIPGPPSEHKTLYNICTTSAQRLRRWSYIVQMLYKCFVFTGHILVQVTIYRRLRIRRDTISTNPKPTIYRNLYDNTSPQAAGRRPTATKVCQKAVTAYLST